MEAAQTWFGASVGGIHRKILRQNEEDVLSLNVGVGDGLSLPKTLQIARVRII